jgi:hypothetical protein
VRKAWVANERREAARTNFAATNVLVPIEL